MCRFSSLQPHLYGVQAVRFIFADAGATLVSIERALAHGTKGSDVHRDPSKQNARNREQQTF